MNGFLNINKPEGLTSHDVIRILRKILKIKKIGHLGTLDPQAEGVLPIALGSSTRLIEFIKKAPKIYQAEITLGIKTDTGDAQGKILENLPFLGIKKKQIKQELKKFIGIILQTPPLISAVHFQGKRLYELAREGKKVNPPKRKVEIKEIKIIKINIPKILIKVICGEGVYIRSLAVDLGEKLTIGAHLSSLIRLKSGSFKIKEALSLEKLEKKVKENKLKIISPLKLLEFPLIILKDEELKKIKLGQKIFKEEKFNKNQMLSLVNQKKEINAVGKYLDGFIQPIKVLV